MRRSFLETDRYPTAVFVLTALTAPPGPLIVGRPVSGRASGTFTLHGVTRPVSPAVTVTRGRDAQRHEVLHIIASFTVRLADYGIATPRFLFFAVRQEHPVALDISAVGGNAP